MKQLLKLKHWQLFLLIYTPVFVGVGYYIYGVVQVMGQLSPEQLKDASNSAEYVAQLAGYLPVVLLIINVGTLLFYAWMWAIGDNLHHKLPADVTMPLQWFKIAMVVAVVTLGLNTYNLFIVLHKISDIIAASGDLESITPDTFKNISAPGGNTQMLGYVASFYNMYFIAKLLKSIELRTRASVNDYLGNFFLLIFSIIGIWFLQPKINRFVEEDFDDDLEHHLIDFEE